MFPNKLKVAAYCRVSTDKDDQTNSLKSQQAYFSSYIKEKKEWEFIEIYYDEGLSGTQTRKRAGFNRMIQDALHGRIDLILTKEVSRFARNTVDTLSFTRLLKDYHVGVIFTLDHIDTRDCDGELRLTIMASLAQEESRKTSERVKWGQQRRMEQGVVFGRDLIGYHVHDGQLNINTEEVPLVRAVFHKYTNEGKGTHLIAKELMEEGFHPKRVSSWSNAVILRMLRNEKYVGDLCQKKTFTPNYLTHKKKNNHGEEEMIYLRNHHEPIIDRHLWNRTQKELKRRSPSSLQKQKYSNRYWCSGKLICGECGQHFVSRTKQRRDCSIYHSWRCYSAINPSSCSCHNVSINHRSIFTIMQYCLNFCCNQIIYLPALKKDILKEIKKHSASFSKIRSEKEPTAKVQKLEQQIQHLEEKKRKTIDLFLEKNITKEDLIKQTKWYENQQAFIENQISENRISINQISENQRILYPNQEQEFRTKNFKIIDNNSFPTDFNHIMEFGEENESFFQEVLETIILYKDHSADLWLKHLPIGFHLTFHCQGRRENFTTKITDMKIIKDSNTLKYKSES